MITTPCTLYINRRPKRIAFIVDRNDPKAIEWVISIIKYNQRLWGGRFNPIVLCENGRIDDDWWKVLSMADPDCIKTFCNLDEDTISKISSLSPLLVEGSSEYKNDDLTFIDRNFTPARVYLTRDNVRRIASPYSSSYSLISFESNKERDSLVSNFIQINFGNYSSENSVALNSDFQPSEKLCFQMNNLKDLSHFLEKTSQHYRFFYPTQLSILPNDFPESKHDIINDRFIVIIGSSVDDIALSWNLAFVVPKFQRNMIRYIWLPLGFINDTDLGSSLINWLTSYSYKNGISEISFLSSSLSKDELNAAVDSLVGNRQVHKTVFANVKPLVPKILKLPIDFNLNKNEFYKLNGLNEKIALSNISINLQSYSGSLMADVYIQSDSPTRRQLLLLPKINNIAFDMFKQPSRIKANGLPSVSVNTDDSGFNLDLPDEMSICKSVLMGDNHPYYTVDVRPRSKKFYYAQISDKGAYLAGFVSLFSDLERAYMVFEEPYWRHVFYRMSGQNVAKDESRKIRLLKKLKQSESQLRHCINGEKIDFEWLSDFIIKNSIFHNADKEVPFKFFKKELERLIENNAILAHDILDEEDLEHYINDFIASNVFLIGTKEHCDYCGLANWYHINQMHQTLCCSGCGSNFPVSNEPIWHYRLNSLIEVGCSLHGLIPVVMALGSLQRMAKFSFISVPSMNLYRTRSDIDENLVSKEIDVVAVIDGQFVIGEVKQSQKRFHRKDFEDMITVSKILKPDVLVFSSQGERPDKQRQAYLSEAINSLASLGIKVLWLT